MRQCQGNHSKAFVLTGKIGVSAISINMRLLPRVENRVQLFSVERSPADSVRF